LKNLVGGKTMKNKLVLAIGLCMGLVILSYSAVVVAIPSAIGSGNVPVRLVYGDVNQDGVTNMGDIIKLERFIIGLDGMPMGENILCGDLNRNGRLDMGDRTMIIRRIIGLDTIPAWWIY